MARVRYFVVRKNSEWRITFEGKDYGPYQSQKEAIRYAVDAAHKAMGDAQVLVQGTDSRFRVEWTYGNDPYPPPG